MDSMGAVFAALGSGTRRRILDIVKGAPGCTVGAVAAHFDTTRIAVMRHIRVLETAGLLLSEKQGRRRCLYHNAAPIQMIYDRWTTEYSAFWASQLADLKYRVEGHAGRKKDDANPEAGVEDPDPGKDRGRVA